MSEVVDLLNEILDELRTMNEKLDTRGNEYSDGSLEDIFDKLKINYICLFDYLFISSQMSAKPYFIGSTGILLLW